ncbi:Uncharacterised protein [Bartonella vinsonii]|uniref:Uncharacterized protein n=1 Tax=Bartonella vinsonii TaxID=33047 RepID=A0A448V7G3_BARVI|nr:Uncharacterised protein [Bartonella vinsonii]
MTCVEEPIAMFLSDFLKEQKGFSLCLISIILFLFAGSFRKMILLVVERVKKQYKRIMKSAHKNMKQWVSINRE